MNSSGDGYSFLRGAEDDQEEEISIKEEEVGNPRSFALFDSPSASKFRFSTKTSQFYDKHVSSVCWFKIQSINKALWHWFDFHMICSISRN